MDACRSIREGVVDNDVALIGSLDGAPWGTLKREPAG